jgi:nucleotide-binding universal stress UspA family protein
VDSVFSRIVVGLDDSEPSTVAVALAARLAREHDGRLFLCHSVNWLPVISELVASGATVDTEPIVAELKQAGQMLLDRAAETAKQIGVEAQRCVTEGDPAESVLRIAADNACTAIVMGTHGRTGWKRLAIGSTTEGVLRGSTLPVLTVRPNTTRADDGRRCFERIVVAIDDSEPSDAAVRTVLAFPPEDCRDLVFCSVVDVERVPIGHSAYSTAIHSDLHGQAWDLVRHAAGMARRQGIEAEAKIVEGNTDAALVALARERKVDLLVVGSHGRRGLQRFFLGSVAERLVRIAPVPVMVVRGSESAAVPTPVRAEHEVAPA